ncbi:MAG: hypothetical protein ACFFD4_21035 [Candidatus Odinarchaeota archaeon]
MSEQKKKKWTKEDHVIALYLYRFGMESLGDPTVLLELLNISISSMTMKFANLISAKYGEKEGKLRTSELDREVVEKYGSVPEPEYRRIVMDIIFRKLKG